jgi:membrane-bound lytic murein transglycosylase MltF
VIATLVLSIWTASGYPDAEARMSIPYEDLFRESGAEFGVPWWMMAGMAHETSHFNPLAVGPTDDHGIMQVICANTETCGLSRCSELHNPRKNIRCAARLLARHFARIRPLVSDDHDVRRFVMLANNLGWGGVNTRLENGPRSWTAFKAAYPTLQAKYEWVEKMDRRAESYRPSRLGYLVAAVAVVVIAAGVAYVR